MRKYQPIWEELKEKHSLTLVAPADMHQTIVNMVQKEKSNDTVWKLQCANSCTFYRLFNKRSKRKETITFTLKRSYSTTQGNL